MFDVSEAKGGEPFDTLSDALAYADTVLLVDQKKGGMTIKYVQSSDNKYMQYRLMSTAWSTNVANWQGVDDEPTAGSDNMVKSGGVLKSITEIAAGQDTDYDAFNAVVQEIYTNNPSVFNDVVSVFCVETEDNKKQVVFHTEGGYFGFTAAEPNEELNGVYTFKHGSTTIYLYIRKWNNVTTRSTNFNFSNIGNLNSHPVIHQYFIANELTTTKATADSAIALANVLDKDFSQISFDGDDNTVVSGSVNVNVGTKYILYAENWNVSNITTNDTNVLQFFGISSDVILRIVKYQLSVYQFPFVFTAAYSKYNFQVRANVGTTVTFTVKEYDESEEKRFNSLQTSIESNTQNISLLTTSNSQQQVKNGLTFSLIGNGSTIVSYNNITPFEIGKKYVLYIPKWSTNEIDNSANVIQLFYYSSGATIVERQIKKSELPNIVKIVFTAQSSKYNINFRGDAGETVVFFIREYDKLTDEEIDRLSNEQSINYWYGKSIAWYGTSIPAGGYPQIVGSLLKAAIYNYAKGSSATVGGNSYLAYDRNLGHTIAEKVAMVKDTWTIDDTNQTFVNGPRTMGFSDYPDYTTYAQVKAARLSIITSSYEVVFLVRTLLSDSIERTSFLQSALGDLYDYMMANHASSFAYHDVDLWVLDHGHNDNCGTDPSQLDMNQVNLTTFVGAMNKYIGLISQYKPHARICMVSDYDDFDMGSKRYTIETQQAIADRWHLPIIRIDKYLPFNVNTKVRTRGYWDADAVWHDTGFVWGSLNGNMIGNGHFPNYIILKFYESGRPSRTIEELTALLNPSQDAAGNWWYDLEPRYIWLFDGLHPHSVAGGYALKMYAEPVAELLKEIGTNGY